MGRMKAQRFYTYAAVSDRFREQCGESGVLDFFRSSFKQCVVANGSYGALLESWTPLSSKEAKSLGLTRHAKAIWYRLDGSAIQGGLVGAATH